MRNGILFVVTMVLLITACRREEGTRTVDIEKAPAPAVQPEPGVVTSVDLLDQSIGRLEAEGTCDSNLTARVALYDFKLRVMFQNYYYELPREKRQAELSEQQQWVAEQEQLLADDKKSSSAMRSFITAATERIAEVETRRGHIDHESR